MAGDTETGMELMLMEEGLDTGPVGLREVVPIRPEDTAGDLAAQLTEIAAALTSTTLDAIKRELYDSRLKRASERRTLIEIR